MELNLSESILKLRNPDGGMPYTQDTSSFSEPTLLTILAFIAEGKTSLAEPLVEWVLKNRNKNGSIGLNHEYPYEGLWNTPLLAIVTHHLGLMDERDSAIEFILGLKSITFGQEPDNDLNSMIVGWPWVPGSFSWVEPTSWALIALRFAAKINHPRAVEGCRLLKDRCLPQGGWNYGNKQVFNNTLLPFADTTALALLALDDNNSDITQRSLALLEKSFDKTNSLLGMAWICLCLARFGKETKEISRAVRSIFEDRDRDDINLAHMAIGMIALAPRKVLTP